MWPRVVVPRMSGPSPAGLERTWLCVVPAVTTPTPTGVSARWMLGSESMVTVTAVHGAYVSTKPLECVIS